MYTYKPGDIIAVNTDFWPIAFPRGTRGTVSNRYKDSGYVWVAFDNGVDDNNDPFPMRPDEIVLVNTHTASDIINDFEAGKIGKNLAIERINALLEAK